MKTRKPEGLQTMGTGELELEFIGNFYFVRDTVHLLEAATSEGLDTLDHEVGGHLLEETKEKLEKLHSIWHEALRRLVKIEQQAYRDPQAKQKN